MGAPGNVIPFGKIVAEVGAAGFGAGQSGADDQAGTRKDDEGPPRRTCEAPANVFTAPETTVCVVS